MAESPLAVSAVLTHCLRAVGRQDSIRRGPRRCKMTSKSQSLLIFLSVMLIAGCKRNEQTQSTNPATTSPAVVEQSSPGDKSSPAATPNLTQAKAKTDACALLTSAEIEDVQKETVKETKLSGSSQAGFSVSQCFFTLPTFTSSISLQVTERGEGSSARDPKEFWRETFHREGKSEKRQREEKEREKLGRSEEEEKGEGAPPLKVTGVGDEAFWVGSRVGGALYVLKGNSYLRVSIGGAGAQTEKIQKSKSLAQRVAARL
jgi:hypothetical protein